MAKDEGFLLDLVTRLILHAQFDQFWTFRVDQFRRRINKFARTQMEATKVRRGWGLGCEARERGDTRAYCSCARARVWRISMSRQVDGARAPGAR